jgi:transposase
MKQMIHILDKDLEYMERERLCDVDIIYVRSKKCEGVCPYCGQVSHRTHSTYDKRLFNFAVGRQDVKVILMKRTLFCDNAQCKHTTFAQRFNIAPDFLEREEAFKRAYTKYLKECPSQFWA